MDIVGGKRFLGRGLMSRASNVFLKFPGLLPLSFCNGIGREERLLAVLGDPVCWAWLLFCYIAASVFFARRILEYVCPNGGCKI